MRIAVNKKTNEQYIEELKEKNPNVIPLEQYVDAKTKIKHKCLKHNIEWDVSPAVVLSGCGCSKCRSEKIRNRLQKSQEEYDEDLKLINPNLVTMSDYKGKNKKVWYKCKLCNFEFEAFPPSISRGMQCPNCHINPKRKTQEQFEKDLFNINPNINVLGEYKGNKVPIKLQCKIDGCEWNTQPWSVLSGHGCPECAKKKLSDFHFLSDDEYNKRLNIIHSDIIALEKYKGYDVQILHKCCVCGNEWYVTPDSLLQGHSCPKCSREKVGLSRRLDNDDYVDRVLKINNEISVIDDYKTWTTPILHRCNICGCEWYATPAFILKGGLCPECNINSNGEHIIKMFLDNNKYKYEMQKSFEGCVDKKHLRFDFYLPEYSLAIEFDGIQHYKPVERFGGEEKYNILVKHDKIKNEYCLNNKINLLRIPYWEQKNIETIITNKINELNNKKLTA